MESIVSELQINETELRIRLVEESTYDGKAIWKIQDFNRRMRNAMEDQVTSIYSAPFYTGRDGYKMCILAYLNGDGIGKGTHLSLFFVLMRGEYDNILKWPFKHKVKMILMNQNNSSNNIAETFQPDPTSTSFQKPTSDMNIASGFPRFVTHNLMGPSDCFVVEDTIFIECIVDTAHVSQ